MTIPPLALLSYFALDLVLSRYQILREINHIEAEVGIALRSNTLIHTLQQERGLSSGFLGSGGLRFKENLSEIRPTADRAFEEFNEILSVSVQGTNLQKTLAALARREEIRRRIDSQEIGVPAVIAYYTEIIEGILRVQGSLAGRVSNSAIMRDLLALQNLVRVKEASGLERAVVANTLARGSFGPGMRDRLLQLESRQNSYEALYLQTGQQKLQTQYSAHLKSTSHQSVLDLRRALLKQNDFTTMPAERWWTTASERINGLNRIELNSAKLLLENLAALKTAEALRMVLWMGLALSGLVLSGALFFFISRRIIRSIGDVSALAEELAQGDFTGSIQDRGEDEIGMMFTSLGGMSGSLSGLVINIRDAGTQIQTAAGRVELLSRNFDGITKNLASTSEESATANEELLSSVENVNDSLEKTTTSATKLETGSSQLEKSLLAVNSEMGELARLAAESAEQGQAGRTAIDRIETAMSAIHESSDRISEIMGLIRDISDQTNLLSLNASIEAARAGEQGRGFAVVASEISNLADRTLHGVKDIDALIGNLREQVDAGTDQTRDAKAVVHEMTGGIDHINAATGQIRAGLDLETSRFREIAREINLIVEMTQNIEQASREQKRAVNETNDALQNVSNDTQDTANGSTELADISRQLKQHADDLGTMLTRFRV